MNRISFKFTVDTSLDERDIERLRVCETIDARLDVLNEIFGEDPNIWEAYYVTALAAFDKENGTDA